VGKFSPLHNGHVKLLNEAKGWCKHLIIISYTNPLLGFSDTLRYTWLKHLYPDALVIVPKSEECPHNDADGNIHREFCAKLIERSTNVRPEVVFTSEDYGDGFAQFLSNYWDTYIDHCYVDDHWRFENNIPIALSATHLRENPQEWVEHTPEFVRKTRTKRLCLLGGESSGKTTLAKTLSEVTGYPWVPEYGRQLCEELGGVDNLKFEHYVQIGKKQVELEEDVLNHATEPWIICDTSPLVTRFYSMKLHGQVDPELLALSQRKYDMTFVLGMSHGWHQDGDRMSPEFSKEQELYYWRQLSLMQEDFTRVFFIDGHIHRRVDKARELLEKYNEN